MDAGRFDALVRSLSAVATRRAWLGAVAGGAAGTLVRFGPDDAAAKCTNLGKKCNKKRGDRCCNDGKCQGGKCRCPGGATEINGACFFPGSCPPGADICDARCGNAPSSGLHDGCYCGTTVENQTLCFKNASLCERPCQTSDDCPKDQACFVSNCQPPSGTCLKPFPRQHLRA